MGSIAPFKKRTTIFLVRHAECMGNVLGSNMSPELSFLTEQGKLQAKLLGELIKNKKFTRAYASDYVRAVQTAETILSQSTVSRELPVLQSDLLREKHLGILEGEDYKAIMLSLGKSLHAPFGWVPEGGETTEVINRRIESFLQEVFDTVKSDQGSSMILAVTHCGFILHFLKYLLDTPTEYSLRNGNREHLKLSRNTSYFSIAFEKDPPVGKPREVEIQVAHGTHHLQALRKEDVFQKLAEQNGDFKALKTCIHQ